MGVCSRISSTVKTCQRILFAALVTAQFAYAAPPALVNVTFGPANPAQGDTLNCVIRLLTPFNSPKPVNTYVTANVDGRTVLALLHPSDNLWVTQLGPYDAISSHQLNVQVSVQDAQDAQNLQSQIVELDQDIATLQDQIKFETDPTKKAQLEVELQQDQASRAKLAQELAETTKPVGSQQFLFSIAASPSSNYPHISSITPAYGPTAGGSQIVLKGNGFLTGSTGTAPNTAVYFGGVQADPAKVTVSSDGTQIQAIVPPQSTPGSKDVEIRVANGADYKNAVMQNGFYALPGTVNVSPVAIVSAPLYAPIGQPIILDGSASYGQLGQTMTYNWSLANKPATSSAIFSGSPGSAKATLTPDAIGTYVVQFSISSGGYTSQIVDAVVIGYQPGNLQITSDEPLSFATRVGNPQSVTVHLANLSNLDPVTVTDLSLSGDKNSEFSGLPPVPFTLAPDQSIPLTLTYSPKSTSVLNPPSASSESLSLQLTATASSANGATLNLSPQVTFMASAYEPFPLAIEAHYETSASPQVVSLVDQGLDIPAVFDQANYEVIYVRNTATHPVTINSAPQLQDIGRSELINFSIDPITTPITLQPGAQTSITVRATPSPSPIILDALQATQFVWNLNLAPVDTAVQFPLYAWLMPNPGKILPNPITFPVTAQGSTSTSNYFGIFYDTVNPSFVELNDLWLFRVTSFQITGADAQYFLPVIPSDAYFQPPFLAGADFGAGAGVVPTTTSGRDYEQIWIHLNLKFNPPATPPAGHSTTYTANIQFTLDGLSTPVILPFTATTSSKDSKELP